MSWPFLIDALQTGALLAAWVLFVRERRIRSAQYLATCDTVAKLTELEKQQRERDARGRKLVEELLAKGSTTGRPWSKCSRCGDYVFDDEAVAHWETCTPPKHGIGR